MRYARITPVFGIIVLFVCIVTVIVISLVNTPTWTNTYLLPKGYSGWIEIMYDQKGFPPLQQDRNGYVIPVPNSGLIKTSSSIPKLKYWTILTYYVDLNGIRTEINGEDVRGGGTGCGVVDNSNGTETKLQLIL